MDKLKILIVEDEPIVALDIESSLNRLGYEVVDSVTNYDDALLSIGANTPDIIFMDINLNNSKSGIEIAKEVKKTQEVAIIYLTAFSDDETMQAAIETDPVNYLLKPFKREELKSSILLGTYKIKNKNKSVQTIYLHIGHDYYFDTENLNLFYKDQPIHLSSNEKKLLELLIDANSQIVPTTVIEEYLWPNKNVSDSAFRTLIYRLRSKLEFKLLENIPSFGYKLTK